jgi:uncharacterized protein
MGWAQEMRGRMPMPPTLFDLQSLSRRKFLKLGGAASVAVLIPACTGSSLPPVEDPNRVLTRGRVPDPQRITFTVQRPGNAPIILGGHFWYDAAALARGMRCPAVVELNPYRCRDGTMRGDSTWYPYFAYCGYLFFRVDLQGSGDSEGVLTDEYTDEEIAYCIQVIEQIALHPDCDGRVGMMGSSWSAINSLMVAAHPDCPSALKAIFMMCGHDDRFDDDIHYKGGSMMQDNFGWAASMWGWLTQPPDPLVVGPRWQEMWRTRIQNAEFWFDRWVSHPTRDDYWTHSSVRGHYDRVKVPVFILSGWQDGYKNPVPRVVSGLAAAGQVAYGLLGPWGHSSPDAGYPGPRIDWLPYMMTQWWDRWLKDIPPDRAKTLAPLTVWLGESREPDPSPNNDERGRWAAEDADWQSRVVSHPLYFWPDATLVNVAPPDPGSVVSPPGIIVNGAQLETSSYGAYGNDDLPGDQRDADTQSIHFTSDPLANDLDCFGHPVVTLNLICDKLVAALVVRLGEVSPETGAVHLVSYAFHNLCHRDGGEAHPQPIPANSPFSATVELDLLGHTFKKGWRIRLALAPANFPTLWQTPELPAIRLLTGPSGDAPPGRVVLPARASRVEDAVLAARMPSETDIAYVDAEDYLPMTSEREANDTRTVEPITVDGKPGFLVRKIFDYGNYSYGGPLAGLRVDQVAEENYRIFDGDPLSHSAFSEFSCVMTRPSPDWRIRSTASSHVWSERVAGHVVFNYRASIQTFIRDAGGVDQPFEQKTLEGTIPRVWI